MAENDTHYNGTSDMSDNDAAAPLPELEEEKAVYPDDAANIPVAPLPEKEKRIPPADGGEKKAPEAAEQKQEDTAKAITATTTGDIMETAGATASCLLLPRTPQFPRVITARCGS